MKPILTPGLREEPARLAARSVGRLLLLKVLETAARLEVRAGESDPGAMPGGSPGTDEDPEAVHDFRVALRRLRSWLQVFRPFLDDTVTRGSEKQLRRLSRRAGAARDLQVQCASLRAMAEAGGPLLATDARRIEGRLAREEFRIRGKLIREIVKDLPKSSATLARQLQRGRLAAGRAGSAEPAMAAAMAVLLDERLEVVRTSLNRLKRAGQSEMAHAARIAVKRLRYLLETFGSSSRLAASAVLRLTEVQDAFGRLHDAQVLTQRIAGFRPRPALRARVRRELAAAWRDARRLSRSRDIVTAREATLRLIRRLEHRSRRPVLPP